MKIRVQLLCAVVALGALFPVGCSEDERSECVGSICTGFTAKLNVFPDPVVFTTVAIDVPSVQYLTISNLDEAALIVTQIDLQTSSREFSIGNADTPFTVGAGEERVIEVWYRPTDCRDDRASLAIYSNDADLKGDPYVVQLVAPEMGGQVRVHPNPIEFGRVPGGSNETQTVTITNSGTCELSINDIFLTGSFDLVLTEPAGDGWAELDLEPLLPVTLAPAETFDLDVTYHPEIDGYDDGTLIIRSDDARNGEVQVPIYANSEGPCIIVTDEAGIDFGQRLIDSVHDRAITVTNCSPSEELVVSSLALGPHWELGGLGEIELRFTDNPEPTRDAPWRLVPGGADVFTLRYSPINAGSDGAILTVRSNDEAKDPLDIEVRALGSDNQCPVAVAQARVLGARGPWMTEIDTVPVTTLELNASESYDSDGEIATYRWELVDPPTGSSSAFAPNPDVAEPTFFLAVTGTYHFVLSVFDNESVESCEPGRVLVLVSPEGDIHVEMSWVTDGDPNPNDTGAGRGADVDLHFAREPGPWNESPNDTFWRNRGPGWGDSGDEDDPSLDLDDTDGWGPENATLSDPEDGMIYRVGAYYYSDHNFGPSDVRVRIWIGEDLRFDATYRNLRQHEFWDIARIEWPSRDISRVNLVTDGFPAW
jgi:hypothetical protein